jgi:hypothetical protein
MLVIAWPLVFAASATPLGILQQRSRFTQRWLKTDCDLRTRIMGNRDATAWHKDPERRSS